MAAGSPTAHCLSISTAAACAAFSPCAVAIAARYLSCARNVKARQLAGSPAPSRSKLPAHRAMQLAALLALQSTAVGSPVHRKLPMRRPVARGGDQCTCGAPEAVAHREEQRRAVCG